MLSESVKSALGFSEIAIKCKRLHLNLQMWALLHLFGLFSVVCIPFIRILLIRFKSNKIYSGSTLICSLFRLSFCAGAGFGRGAAPPETGNELLFHCYLFPVPPPHTRKTAGRVLFFAPGRPPFTGGASSTHSPCLPPPPRSCGSSTPSGACGPVSCPLPGGGARAGALRW